MGFGGIWGILKVAEASSENLGMAGRGGCVQKSTGDSGLEKEASLEEPGRPRDQEDQEGLGRPKGF